MWSRILDPRDGRPRDPVFWLVTAAVALVQLLALWTVCAQQVRKADDRRQQAQAQQVAGAPCLQDSRCEPMQR